jgi:hypothetical protein
LKKSKIEIFDDFYGLMAKIDKMAKSVNFGDFGDFQVFKELKLVPGGHF